MKAKAERYPMSTAQKPPKDAADRKAVAPVICYPTHSLPQPDLAFYRELRAAAKRSGFGAAA